MPYRVYAMDTHFYTPLGVYEFDARCEMLAELGYDATYLTMMMNEPGTWEDLKGLKEVTRRLEHPRLGTMFCGFHWYAIDGKDLVARLNEASPYLRQVNLCGSRRDPDGLAVKATIEPLDSGELDNFAILGLLKSTDYRGMI